MTKQSISIQKFVDCHEAKASRKDAFTLAEVLITLVIIGVIAAITVPTLITKYQKEQTVTRLKKAYSALSQTTQKAIADNGPMNTWKYTSDSDRNSLNFAKQYLFPYLNIMNKCVSNTQSIITTGDCDFKYHFLNGNSLYGVGNNPRFILSDGTKMAFSCTYSSANGSYCWILIDINGDKKPNRMGKDIFRYFYLVIPGSYDWAIKNQGKFMPFYSDYNRSELTSSEWEGSCNKNTQSRAGESCAALIMKDGWQIKDDYPW